MKLILGSKSPRRQQLLQEMGYKFEVRVQDTDESYPSSLVPHEVALHIARQKAIVLIDGLNDGEVVLTADTIVCVEDKILGKPTNKEEALEMLRLLSGKKHLVITSVVLGNASFMKEEYASTAVEVKAFTEEELNYYVDNYKPYDKAGSYGIQEWFGAVGIVGIEGTYNNVVGLPTHLVYSMIQNMDFQ